MANRSKTAGKSRKPKSGAAERQFRQAFVPGTAWANNKARRYFGVSDPVTDIAFLTIVVALAASAAIAVL